MNNYDFLEKYIYDNLEYAESDIDNFNGHFFLKLDDEDNYYIKKIEEILKIKFSQILIQFYKKIGIGQLFSQNRDEYINRYTFLWPYEILGLYIEDYDEDNNFAGSRINAIESLENNNRLSFMEASEHDFFEISLDDESIWIFGRKIANSLEEFLIKVLEDPDYHHR